MISVPVVFVGCSFVFNIFISLRATDACRRRRQTVAGCQSITILLNIEKVQECRTTPRGGNNSELEKFKRRLIRAVARMLIYEKRNEDEVWVGLKKETGCDCKELWSRMYALTLKKLERLLLAGDRIDILPKAARMSITDWLMFDTVLVHEDFDVIGMSETMAYDRKILVDLFDLVEEHKIEFLAGDKLTEAWLKVTLQYNRPGRQCTPMLLQRRWYQLKLATRARFYKFWAMYKGVPKRQHLAEPYKPTPLQASIAMRYKPLVVKPFMAWEELIVNCLVILPEQFEYKGNIRAAKSEDVPDVMCVEPVVETIDLDADSDTELEYRKPVHNSHLAPITIKKEPIDDIDIDENYPYKSRQERILHFAEAALEATAMELDEFELADDTDVLLSSNPVIESESLCNEQSEEDKILDDVNPSQDNVTEITLNKVESDAAPSITAISEDDVSCVSEDQNNAISISKNDNIATYDGNDVNSLSEIGVPSLDSKIESLPVTDDAVNEVQLVKDVETEDNDVEMQIETEPVLPQITSVFGGVDISNETLSKIGLLTAQITNSVNKDKPKNTPEPQIASTTSIAISSDSSDVSNSDVLVLDDTLDEKSNSEVDAKTTKNTWFGELSNDIDFVDDGIQFVDDGIEYIDDESANQISEIISKISHETHEEDEHILDKTEEDVPKVDEKLLMVPTVNIVKLDDMNILPIHLLNHINSKSLINIITFKSNPIKKTVLQAAEKKEVNVPVPINEEVDVPVPIKKEVDVPVSIKKEVDASGPMNTEIDSSIYIKKEADESESSDEDIIDESKKVKLSSILLQKPRSLSYNSIKLCKNPDFNTRLKKLNIGFFGSTRNRLLLKACQPLSIDVSKAFEHKLVNGTMYLKKSNNDSLHLDTEPKMNSQNVSVLPSAMSVQSLIDNTKGDIPPASYGSITVKPIEVATPTCERNKIINLPDISEIRRINQKLLTAEVTPLRLKDCTTQVPVTLVMSTNINQSIYTTEYGKAIPGPASRTKLLYSQVVDITKADNTNKDVLNPKNVASCKDSLKPTTKKTWKPKLKPETPWFSNKNSIYAEDTLLALDTLNKMLYLITEPDAEPPVKSKKKKKKNKKGLLTKEKSSTLKSSLKDDENDDLQVVSENKLDNAEAKKCRKGKINFTNQGRKKTKFVYCCWARERICQLIFSKKSISKHNCPFPLCLCCCRVALIQFIRKKEKCSKNKKLTSAQDIDNSLAELRKVSTEDITVPLKNKDYAADVAEIIPIHKKTAKYSVSDSSSKRQVKETEISIKNVAVNTDKDITTSETTVEIDTEISTSETAVHTDTEISTGETTVNIETEIATNKTAVDKFCSDKPIREVGNRINNKSTGIDIIGAEISVTTSEDVVLIDSQTATTTNADTNARKTMKPLIRVTCAASGSKCPLVEANRRKLCQEQYRRLQVNQRLKQTTTQPVKTAEPPKKVVIIDPTKQFKVQEPTTEKPPRAVFLDPKVPNISPRTYANQKMTYLNSKQISELPTDNPIYLGKNKILLTTAKFPTNFKSFEAFQANIRQTLAMPKGIQLVLLPSGRLTYIKDSKQNIPDEFMTALPHLIEAVQQQINRNNVPPIPSNVQTEVIDLSDDETPENDCTEIATIDLDETKTMESTTNLNIQSDVNNSESSTAHSGSDMMNFTVNVQETKTTESATNITQQSDVNISDPVTSNVETEESDSGKCNNPITTESATELNTQSGVSISELLTSNVETVDSDSGKFIDPITTESATNLNIQAVVTISESLTSNVETVESDSEKLINPITTESTANLNTQSGVTISESLTSNVETVESDSEKLINPITTESTANLNTQSGVTISESLTSNVETVESDSGKFTDPITTKSATNLNMQAGVTISESLTSNIETVQSDIGKIDKPITSEIATNVNTQPGVTISESDTSNVETVENDSGKFNNILSDLMAMSGIEQMDITSTPHENSQLETLGTLPVAAVGAVENMPAEIAQCEKPPVLPLRQHSINPPLLQPINSTSEQNSSFKLVHTPKDDDHPDGKTKPSIGKVLSAALTPITSLSELKYACAQSGKFFKLDLDSGLLLPINVCMKKITESGKKVHNLSKEGQTVEPKPIIDLTDDDVEITEITQMHPKSILIANQPNENCAENRIISTSSESPGKRNRYIDPSIGGYNISKDGQVKPLKLFKSSGGRPTILERKLKQINERIVAAQTTQDNLRRKLKRKQEFKKSIRNENAENSYSIASSDDSSDEEPLAKIATKMRAAEKEDTEDIENVNDTPGDEMDLPANSRSDTKMEPRDDLPDAFDEHMDDEPNPMVEDEHMSVECLDDTILEEDEPEEDCILGV